MDFEKMTASQTGVYLECAEDPATTKYNIPMLCYLPKNIDKAKFIRAVQTVCKKHPVFFVNVCTPDGVPSMKTVPYEVAVVEKTVDDLMAEAEAFIRPFDLENEPLFRFELLTCGDITAFLFDVHHIIFDGTSIARWFEQIAAVYGGKTVSDEEKTVFDLSKAEQTLYDSDEYKAAQAFFKEKFEGVEWDGCPMTDRVEKTEPKSRNIRVTASLSENEVLSYTKAHGFNEGTFFFGAFAFALAKMNGTNEAMFSTPSHGRHDKAYAQSCGMFVRTIPLHFVIDETAPVERFLSEVKENFFATVKHDGISFAELAKEYGIRNDMTFIYHGNILDDVPLGDGKIVIDMMTTPDLVSDLNFAILKTGDRYRASVYYKEELYSEGFIRSLISTYFTVLRSFLTAPTLSDVTFLSEDAERTLDSFNDTAVAYEEDKTVVDLFREQAKKNPDNVCLVFKEKRFTYREVDEMTDRFARYLADRGITKETVVGVLIPRCEYILLASLSVLKAGGGYLPLDPSYPPERLNLMVEDAEAKLLIYDPSLADIITSDFTGERVSTADVPSLDGKAKLTPPSPGDLFVMLYTSGSTGKPKGVMFEHKNARVTTEWVRRFYRMDGTSHVTLYASYGFDAHVFDMYSAIDSGAEFHVIAEDIRLDFPALRDYYNDNGITHTVMTTQIARQFALLGGLKTLRHLSGGGEKLTPLDPPDDITFHNVYGPTEGSVITSEFTVDRRYQDVPIGTFVDNLKGYVVDKNGKRLPVGGVGELWIAGPHVTRGYKNRPEKTAEAYGENPYGKDEGYERVYRTGDIVRFLSDGNLQFVGRRDAQVKVRGFRVELTEIEEVIRRFDGIQDATVAAFDDAVGGKFLAGYVVSDTPVDFAALADFIRAEKPPYMVPAAFMQLERIPLTQNQKVNKRALPLPERGVGEVVSPETDKEKRLFDLVSSVLGHRDFGVTTDLYDAGLTSIGSVRLNVLLADEFSVSVRTADIKENPTVRKLAAFLGEAETEEAYPLQSDYPLTETQNGVLVECMASPDTTVYNIPVLVKLHEAIDPEKLAAAVRAAADAHPYLKATLFSFPDGSIRARRDDAATVNVPIISCDALPDGLVRPFALFDANLYRIEIYKTPDVNYLFMDIHHLLCDGMSENVLFDAISRAYRGETLKKETFTGFEAALDEEKARKSERVETDRAYWQTLLASSDADCLPKKEPESESGAGNVKASFDGKTVKAYCEMHHLSLNAFFNAAFAFTVSRFSGRDELSHATVYNGRNDSRLAEAVTMLVKTIPVASNLDGEKTVLSFVEEIQKQLLDSMVHDTVPFAELARSYGAKADLMLVYQGDDFGFDTLCGEKAELIDLPLSAAKAPISVSVFLTGDTFTFTLEYRRDCYNAAFAEAFLDALSAAALSFAASEKIKDVTMLSDKAEAVYATLNDSDTPTEDVYCHQLFEAWAEKTPDATAVVAAGESLTFGELNDSANRLAHALIKRGVKADTIVGLVLDRTKEVLTVELGIQKANGAFLPMIPTYPDERIRFCLENSHAPFVITTEEIKAQRPDLFADTAAYRTLTVEELLANDKTENPNLPVEPHQLAYCIYTSGSTGTPKGVMIEAHGFSNFVQTNGKLFRYLRENGTGASLTLSSISFDMSLYELYLPLCAGHTVCIATEEEIHDPLSLKALMELHRVGMMTCTPSFMNNMVSMPAFLPALRSLMTITLGAEAFPASLYGTLRNAVPDLQIINGYGPTEASVCCAMKELHSDKGITIGRPTGNFKFYVVDRFGHILPPYGVGELILCGTGVGRGYIDLPEKTAAAFYTLRGEAAYHSGDLVRLNANAEIDFGGRIDNQVKLRGFRVELDEIEKVLCSFPAVTQSKVLVRNNGTEDYLAGFFTATERVDLDALTSHLKSRLTYYMVPAVLMQIDAMPLTPNGKIDKKGFPEVEKKTVRKEGRRAPKKSLEQRLCEIFASTLGLSEVYADDNFFELGGTSLSASKVTMVLMSDGIEVKYGDIFDHPTPEELADFIGERDGAKKTEEPQTETFPRGTRETLQWNMVKYTPEVERKPLGDVLLTGAVGFLGVHILKELLDLETGHITCLVRRGTHKTAEIRLKTMLIYYFSYGFDEELRSRISVIEADITDKDLAETLSGAPFDTVINCAACVKHFADDDILERINVRGVENLIEVCRKRDAKLIQISTVSVPGIHTKETYEAQVRMHENELFVIDDMDNKYGISKYHAELRVFDAIDAGLRAKVIRVGNLMGRHSDGEFQANMETNMFLSGIRGFALMGKYPISHMTDPMSFSPVDCTARAVVLLAGTNDKFTAFNANNRYGFDEMKIIDACNRNGITILPEKDEVYYEEFRKKLGDDRLNARLNGLAAYDIKDAHAIETDNLFTTNVLYRIGFSWPLVDDSYLDRAIHSILTLDYFDLEEED